MVERTPNFVFSVKSKTDKKLIALKREMKAFNAAVKKIVIEEKKVQKVWNTSDWRPWVYRNVIPLLDTPEVRVTARLGKDNPNAKLYKTKKRKKPHANMKPEDEHADHFDVYVRGTPFLSGYTPKNVKDVRPKYDRENMLHAEDGPAVAVNGYVFYYWHGVQIPEYFIKDKKRLTPEFIFSIRNAETRRIAVEIVGWEHLVSNMKHRIIDKHKNPQVGTLLELQIPISREAQPFPEWRAGRRRSSAMEDDGTFQRQRLLRVQCGTGRYFSIPVVSTVNTALEAQAWMWGIPVKDFKLPEVRT